jgi:hypothetical protein
MRAEEIVCLAILRQSGKPADYALQSSHTFDRMGSKALPRGW